MHLIHLKFSTNYEGQAQVKKNSVIVFLDRKFGGLSTR